MNTMAGKTSKKSTTVATKTAAKRVTAEPTLLSGDNPQIAKGDGDAVPAENLVRGDGVR